MSTPSGEAPRPEAELTPIRWLPAAGLILLAVVSGGTVAYLIADSWADTQYQLLGAEKAAAIRLDAVRTALTVAAGLGAGVTLLLALRRQSITERAQQQTERAQRAIEEAQRFAQAAADRSHELAERDSQERRITDLYVAAVEQLGSDKAPVRLGGLYALERIGNDHPKMRQTVMDVWCAYLRMPFTPPAGVLRADDEEPSYRLAKDVIDPDPEEQPDRRQELQVRLTAQRLITTHLLAPGDGPEPATYWRGPDGARMDLDLTGATLVDLDLDQCQVRSITLAGARQHGDTSMREAQFHGYANVSSARFHRNAYLNNARFHGVANLSNTQFHGYAYLDGVRFHQYVSLVGTQFHQNADLSKARFHDDVDLNEARFHRTADLREAQFHGYADLRHTQFHGITVLAEAQFHDNVSLTEAQFHWLANLTKTRFHLHVDLDDARFHHILSLDQARFHLFATWKGTRLHGPADLSKAHFDKSVFLYGLLIGDQVTLPAEWTRNGEPDKDGLYSVIKIDDSRDGTRPDSNDPADSDHD